MLHYILWWILILSTILIWLDIRDLKIKDNEKIDPINNYIIKEILRNRKIFLTILLIIAVVYWLDLIFLR